MQNNVTNIDIYDDRLTITSPGGMADGTKIQERDISNISSTRRNPILADIFGRLGCMERQGSGFKKITESYLAAHNYRKELAPRFYSDASSFQVTLYNLNYGAVDTEKVAFDDEKVAFENQKAVFALRVNGLKARTPTKDKAIALFERFGLEQAFSRAEIVDMFGIASSSAGKLIEKLRECELIVPVVGQGKGKYKFSEN